MKNWKIHLAWAMVSILAAVLWGRIVRMRISTALETDHDIVKRTNVDTSKHGPPDPLPTKINRPRVQEDPLSAIPSAASAGPQAPMTPDQIRTMLRSRSQWGQGFEALKRLEDRSLKLSILAELFGLRKIDVRIPISAYMQLAEMGGPDAAEQIEKGLALAEDEAMQIRGAKALGQAGATRSIGVLLELYQTGSLDLKVACASSLSKLGHPGPAAEVLATLSRSLDDLDGGIRREAVESIASMGIPSTLPMLTRALRDQNGDVRIEAILGLETLGLPEVIPIIEQFFNDPNASVAQDARNAVKRLRRGGEK
jgi:HEAT repeat protein